MRKLRLLLTFDYELFLGAKSGTVQECLITPTEIIQRILRQNNAKAIFFVDATYLWRLQELSSESNVAANDYDKIRSQIASLVKDGHYIYLHIHPHWIDAVYQSEINQWNLEDTSRYAFSSLSSAHKDLVFTRSTEALRTILPDDYSVEGFRAGGLFIQPFHDFLPFFKKNEILYDFSTLPGFYYPGKTHSFNFGRIKEQISIPFFEIADLENIKGQFVEYPLSVNKVGLLQRILNSICYRIFMTSEDKSPFGKGSSAGQQIFCDTDTRFLRSETVSVEMMNAVKAFYYNRLIQKNGYLHFLSHPKLTNEYNLKVFEKWFSELTACFSVNTDFKEF